jgi:hypothetical protein
MTDIEAKALALVNEVRVERGWEPLPILYRTNYEAEALYRTLERHEAFKQEVSDVVEGVLRTIEGRDVYNLKYPLSRFIIPKPKPDPLADVLEATFAASGIGSANMPKSYPDILRVALDALGFEIREKGQ